MSDSGRDAMRVLTAGAVDVITDDDLRRKLGRGTPLRVKLGIDPTASDIHLGFAVVLRKLRQFQELGHIGVLVLGDFTAQVGDPSGQSATRPRLSSAEVDEHAATYVEQAQRILLPEELEIVRNSEWLSTMGIDDVLRLAARTTVARMLQREDFATRYREGKPISVMELLYPLLQGWDSVMVRADVELGGTDQLFNNLMGRALQEQEGQEAQVVLTTPLLEGLDGVQKMSKSLGNYVGIAEPPAEQFGKMMRIPDDVMGRYFLLTTGWHPDRVEQVASDLREGRLSAVEAKRLLARTIVDLYHGEGTGAAAEAEFDRVFKAHEAPSEVEEYALAPGDVVDGEVALASLLRASGLAPSGREAKRLIAGGGVRLDAQPITDPEARVRPDDLDGKLLQVGRRRWKRISV